MKTKKGPVDVYCHVLVAKAFIINDNPKLKGFVDHKKNNVSDYRIKSLAWASGSNNMEKALKKKPGYKIDLLKEELEREYKNVNCYLASKNLGMGPGNNLGISKCDTNYILILNPDVILESSTIENMLLASSKISSFAILSPLSSNIDYPNYKKFDHEKKIFLSCFF